MTATDRVQQNAVAQGVAALVTGAMGAAPSMAPLQSQCSATRASMLLPKDHVPTQGTWELVLGERTQSSVEEMSLGTALL